MELISEKIAAGTQLHTITVDKFKTNSINIYLQRPLRPLDATYNALLPMVIQRGCEKFKNSSLISKELEYLYGSSLIGDVTKKGEKQIILFSLTSVALDYIDDDNLMDRALDLLNDMLFNPLIEDEGFNREYFNQELANLENKIKGRLNDKSKYALDRCVEEMCRNENYRLYEHGDLEDLKRIDAIKLYQHYEKIIKTSPMDVVVVGSIKHKDAKDFILNRLNIGDREVEEVPFPSVEIGDIQVNNVTEDMDISQGKLTLGYRTNIPYQSNLYPALLLYSSILGGGAHSKLFLKVREERSLCYYIYSKIDKFKGLMLIGCGIDPEKAEETMEVIGQQIQEMIKGNISQDELDNGKQAIITAIEALGDSSSSLAEYTYSQIVGDFYISPEELVKKINEVDLKDLVKVAEGIKLDTTYLLGTKS